MLTRVLSEREPLDEAIEKAWSTARGVPPSARAWVLEVCSGSLRWKGRLDLAIDSVSLKKKPTGWLRKQLLLAAYQLIVQERTAAAPVVSETVSEIKKKEGVAPSKFANAALRRLAEHAVSWRELGFDSTGAPARAAAWASLPEWLWTQIHVDHGEAFAREYAVASLERPTLWLRARHADWQPPEGAEPGPVPGSWRAGASRVSGLAGFSEGEFIVQDISSQQLVVEISAKVRAALGSAGTSGAGLAALDLCAAPGGKSVGLAWEGFQVSASDRDSSRMKLLESTEARVRAGIRIVPKSEVASLPEQDLVWVDAPCTGSGILRRHPEVRWLRQPGELAGLTRVQTSLLREGWEKVRKGGFLAYSVCSVLKQEGPERIREAKLGGARVGAEWLLAPQNGNHGDGFWTTLIQRVD